jgi:hypothetical protein
MSHLIDDIQICLVLAGGGSLTALAISRVRYGEDWAGPWLIMTKVLCALALAVVAVGERAVFWDWWEANSLLAPITLTSVAVWATVRCIFKRKTQDAVFDLELRGDARKTMPDRKSSPWMLYWGLLNLALLLTSLILAVTRMR